MDNYRLLAHKDEIIKMVKKAPVQEIGIIWQTVPCKREIYHIKRLEALSDAMIFHTTLPFEFENDFPVYIKLNYKNLVFKISPEDYKVSNNQMSCVYPKEAKAIEERASERTAIPERNAPKLTLRVVSGGTAQDVEVVLENISERGIGVRVISSKREFFMRNTVFKLIKINELEHKESAIFSVRHISDRGIKNVLNIGFLASMPLSDILFEALRKEMKKEKEPVNIS
jgi:hypothetical protein